MNTELDKKVAALFEKLEAKKNEIAKIEKPKWETNCSFRAVENGTSTNIQAVSDVNILVELASALIIRRDAWDNACKLLGVKNTFKWQTFTFDEWVKDIKTRLARLEIDTKKAELKDLEDKLNRVVSPEQRRALEINALEKSLE